MHCDVHWKIRGKTLSKQFWIFYAVSIFFHIAHLRTRVGPCEPSVVSLFHRRADDSTCSRTAAVRKEKGEKKVIEPLGGGGVECLMGKNRVQTSFTRTARGPHRFFRSCPPHPFAVGQQKERKKKHRLSKLPITYTCTHIVVVSRCVSHNEKNYVLITP